MPSSLNLSTQAFARALGQPNPGSSEGLCRPAQGSGPAAFQTYTGAEDMWLSSVWGCFDRNRDFRQTKEPSRLNGDILRFWLSNPASRPLCVFLSVQGPLKSGSWMDGRGSSLCFPTPFLETNHYSLSWKDEDRGLCKDLHLALSGTSASSTQ